MCPHGSFPSPSAPWAIPARRRESTRRHPVRNFPHFMRMGQWVPRKTTQTTQTAHDGTTDRRQATCGDSQKRSPRRHRGAPGPRRAPAGPGGDPGGRRCGLGGLRAQQAPRLRGGRDCVAGLRSAREHRRVAPARADRRPQSRSGRRRHPGAAAPAGADQPHRGDRAHQPGEGCGWLSSLQHRPPRAAHPGHAPLYALRGHPPSAAHRRTLQLQGPERGRRGRLQYRRPADVARTAAHRRHGNGVSPLHAGPA